MSKLVTSGNDAVILAARRKLDTRFLNSAGEAMTQYAEEKAIKGLVTLGPYAKSMMVMPNYAENSPLDFISGFQLEVVANAAPVLPFSFPCRSMFAGTLAVPLDAFSKMEITDEFISNPVNRVSERLAELVPDVLIKGSASGAKALGTASNYAGVFKMSEKGAHGWKNSFWVVVRATDEEVSRSLAGEIARAAPTDMHATRAYGSLLAKNPAIAKTKAPPHTTWEQFWFKNDSVRQAYQAQRAHRAEVARRVMMALGASPPSMDAIVASNVVVDSVYNSVQKINGNPVLLSDMVDMATTKDAGIVFNETPKRGPVVLRGAFDKARMIEAGIAGFPAGTGKRRSVSEQANRLRLEEDVSGRKEMERTQVFNWSGKSEHNVRLLGKLFRLRSDKWRSTEHKLGYVGDIEELSLRPVKVQLTQTESL